MTPVTSCLACDCIHSKQHTPAYLRLEHSRLRVVLMVSKVFFSHWVFIQLWSTIERRPPGFILKKPHRFDILYRLHQHPGAKTGIILLYVVGVGSESMVYAGRQNNQIAFRQTYPHPLIIDASNIEEAFSIKDVSYLLIFMQMLVEEHLHLFLIHGSHLLRGNDDLIPVFVGALQGNGIYGIY